MPWHPLRSDAVHRFRCRDVSRTGKGEICDEMWGLHSSGAGDVAVSTNHHRIWLLGEGDDVMLTLLTSLRFHLQPYCALHLSTSIQSNSCGSRYEVPLRWHAIVNHPRSETPINLRFDIPLFGWNRSQRATGWGIYSRPVRCPSSFRKTSTTCHQAEGYSYAIALQATGGAWWPCGFWPKHGHQLLHPRSRVWCEHIGRMHGTLTRLVECIISWCMLHEIVQARASPHRISRTSYSSQCTIAV